MFPKIVGFPPKSSILIGFSIITHPFWGVSLFLETPVFPRGVFFGSSFFGEENFNLPEVDTCSVPWIGSIHVLGSQPSGRWMDGCHGWMEVLGKRLSD